jgi:transcriptional regulator with XRE-family HTH domain
MRQLARIMNEEPLPKHLGYACSLYPSIAHVCRRIGINRQQFNKYLAGRARPSRSNMRRICNFFGVTEAELLTEPPRFSELISLRRLPSPEAETAMGLLHKALRRIHCANPVF